MKHRSFFDREYFGIDHGRQVTSLLKRFPRLAQSSLRQRIQIFKSGRKRAVILFPGKHAVDANNLLRSSLFTLLLSELDCSLILVHWPERGYSPALACAALEDVLDYEEIDSVILVGTSYGGLCALELIADIKNRKLPIKILGLVTIVSPFFLSDIRLITRLKLVFNRWQSEFIKYKINFLQSFKVTQLHSPNAGYFSDISLLCIVTEGLDIFVNTQRSTEHFMKSFTMAEVAYYPGEKFFRTDIKGKRLHFNPAGPHEIAYSSRDALRKNILTFIKKQFSQFDCKNI